MPAPATLVCRACSALAIDTSVQYCVECFGPLELRTDWQALAAREPASVTRPSIDAGAGMGRWAQLLAAPLAAAEGVGDVPLRHARVLGERLGLGSLYLLDETVQPTGSYKDRVVATALGEAIARGHEVVACASSGNLALALGEGARRAGLRAVLLVPEQIDAARLSPLVATGAAVAVVRGDYDAANRLATEAAAEWTDVGWVNATLRPWYVEGARTAGFEVVRALGWQLPDAFLAPIASGSYLRLAHDSMQVLATLGLAESRAIRLLGAQPSGCAPVAGAFAAGATQVRPVHAATIATSIAMGDPPEGDELLAEARRTGGAILAAPEERILAAADLLRATEQIDGEPAAGVVVEVLAAMARDGLLGADEVVVAAITGRRRVAEPDLVGEVSAPASIDPTLADLAAILPR